MPHFIFIQQISVLNILNMLYNLHFFSSNCHLFHNATLFGFCITHILNTGCAKIWKKKILRQKVNIALLAHKFEVAPRLLENVCTPGLRVTESCCCSVCDCFILPNCLLRLKLNSVWRIQKTNRLTLFTIAGKPGLMRSGFILCTRTHELSSLFVTDTFPLAKHLAM